MWRPVFNPTSGPIRRRASKPRKLRDPIFDDERAHALPSAAPCTTRGAVASRRRSTRNRLFWAAVALGVCASLIASEFLVPGLAEFWIGRPVLAAFLVSGSTLALVVLIVDDLIQRRTVQQMEPAIEIAFRRLSGALFAATAGFLHMTGFENAGDHIQAAQEAWAADRKPLGDPLLPVRFEPELDQALREDVEVREGLAELTFARSRDLDEALAQWAPVMAVSPRGREALAVFSWARTALNWTGNSAEEYATSERARVTFWSNLRVMLWLFSSFDVLRREALGEESSIFGDEAIGHDRAWGMPFDAQKWLDEYRDENGLPKRGARARYAARTGQHDKASN